MSLLKRFARKDTEELVAILELPESYTPAALKVAEEELISRQIDDATIHEMAVAYNTERLWNLLDNFDPINEKLEVPKSYFLDHETMRTMLKAQFKEFMDSKKGFRFDVMQYALGGI